MFFNCIYISLSLITSMIALVSTQLKLCSPDFKLDSISFLEDRDQWFFTSNGHFWVIKNSQLKNFTDQVISEGKPLPNGFKRGDAAVYKNSLKACQKSTTSGKVREEQEIILIEMIGEWNTIMIYDLRDNTWGEPHRYDKDNCMNQAQVRWNDPIDAMFAFNTTQIYVIQKDRYAGIDFKILCEKPDQLCDRFIGNTYYDFNTKDHIDAITLVDYNKFLMFQQQDFYEGDILKVEQGRMTTFKHVSKNIAKHFFRYKGCTYQNTAKSDHTDKPKDSAVENVGTSDTPDENSFMIILLIIAIIAVIIFIVLITIFVIRKNKLDSEEGNPSPSSTSMSSTGKAEPTDNKKGNSPSTMSLRPNVSTMPKNTAQPKAPSSTPNKKLSPVKSSPKKT